jgi:hypothetical protein
MLYPPFARAQLIHLFTQYVNRFFAPSSNYWDINSPGHPLIPAFMLGLVCSWFDKLTMSEDVQAPQAARPEESAELLAATAD